jgi:RNA polymerase sigma factor (sigma-70 family)
VLPELADVARQSSFDETERAALLVALATLPVRTRAAVVLHYYADVPVDEVAAAMGTSPNTVKTQLRIALERLRAGLADEPTLVPQVEAGNV